MLQLSGEQSRCTLPHQIAPGSRGSKYTSPVPPSVKPSKFARLREVHPPFKFNSRRLTPIHEAESPKQWNVRCRIEGDVVNSLNLEFPHLTGRARSIDVLS